MIESCVLISVNKIQFSKVSKINNNNNNNNISLKPSQFLMVPYLQWIFIHRALWWQRIMKQMQVLALKYNSQLVLAHLSTVWAYSPFWANPVFVFALHSCIFLFFFLQVRMEINTWVTSSPGWRSEHSKFMDCSIFFLI